MHLDRRLGQHDLHRGHGDGGEDVRSLGKGLCCAGEGGVGVRQLVGQLVLRLLAKARERAGPHQHARLVLPDVNLLHLRRGVKKGV
eukprot:121323-Prorocentrum_minimum.AAC.3